MYAVVEIQGSQFKVEKDQKLFVNRIDAKEGSKVSFDNVLLVDDGKKVQVGKPTLSGKSVEAKVIAHKKGDKVIVFKKKRRKGYKVKVGKLSKLRTELREFPNCNKESGSCTCTEPGTADLKMKAIHGMCLNCVVEMDHKLKLEGKYEEYEKKKLLANALKW